MSDEKTSRLHGLGHEPSRADLLERFEKLEARVARIEKRSIVLADLQIACGCGWSGRQTDCDVHHASAGGRSWTDYLCPECGYELKYDPE